MLRMLPAGGTDEECIRQRNDILTGGTVIDGNNALGGCLKKLGDGLGIIIIESSEVLCFSEIT